MKGNTEIADGNNPVVAMIVYRFKSLRTRLIVLLLVPVFLILLAAGMGAFFYARNVMVGQWEKNVAMQLEYAAYAMETNLTKPMALMQLFSGSGKETTKISLLEAIVYRLESLPGVVRVNLNWHAKPHGHDHFSRNDMDSAKGRFRHFARGSFARVSLPVIDEVVGEETISIAMILLDESDTVVGNLEIVLRFSLLVSGITGNRWWQNATTCIADRATGKIILASGRMKGRTRIGESDDPLENQIQLEMAQKTWGTILGKGHPPERVAGFHALETIPWVLVVVADGKVALSPIIYFRNGFMVGATILLAAVYGIIRLNVNRTSNTIQTLSRRAGSISKGDFGEKVEVTSEDEIGRLAQSFNTMVDGLREKETIKNTFGRYVDPDFARTLLKSPESGRLGGRLETVAILMADIRGFTAMAKSLSPEHTIELLNGYFSAIIPPIEKHRGIIVDFVGDGLLAFFQPIEESLADTIQRCVMCAFTMHRAIFRCNHEMMARKLPLLQMGIGINSGLVVVGNVGAVTRRKYGIVGAAVNITQRIQAKARAGEVVVSKSVVENIQSDVDITREIATLLKGVDSMEPLYVISKKAEAQSK